MLCSKSSKELKSKIWFVKILERRFNMAVIEVLNMNGEKVDSLELDDKIFNIEANKSAMHMVVVQYLANQRQGTKSTKTRAEVRGGGRKPWRQKGTGRARQGSIRSPQWRGGGVVFAPKPRDYSFKINKKVKRLALKSALSVKLQENKIVVLDKLELARIKTKDFKQVMLNINLDSKALVVINNNDKNVILSARNLPDVKTTDANIINVYDILKYDKLIFTRDAVNKIQEVYA